LYIDEDSKMSDIANLQIVRDALVAKRRDLASRGAMSPADGGRAATQIRNIQLEIESLDAALADERAMAAATPAAA
jgi:hypothetical protein